MNTRVELVESETIWLLKLDSDCIISESEEISEDIAIELKELEPNVNGKSKMTQTVTRIEISEKEQTNAIRTKEQHSQATTWDLFDSYGGKRNEDDDTRLVVSQLKALNRSLSTSVDNISSVWANMVNVQWPRDPLLQRAEPEEGHKLKLEFKMMWSDGRHATKVNCIACNPHDRMLFAVAYQNLSTHKGFVTCWNVQNVTYPELVISISTNPTIVKFSYDNPKLVAVGDESGMVRFISIHSASGHFVQDQVHSTGHKGAVLDLCWVGNKVMSSGSDGRVLMWTIANAQLSLESQVIAELQPSFYNLELPRVVELTILNQPDCLPTPSAICCVAPLKSDPDHFIIGSEDGSLHTFSFVESYLPILTKQRHVGAVVHAERVYYQGKELIISLGNDSMIFVEQLKGGKKKKSSLVWPLFQEPYGMIITFTCNPNRPELMAILTSESIELWKIFPAASILASIRRTPDSIIKNCRLTTITFAYHSKALLVGDESGKIHVYSHNYDSTVDSIEQ